MLLLCNSPRSRCATRHSGWSRGEAMASRLPGPGEISVVSSENKLQRDTLGSWAAVTDGLEGGKSAVVGVGESAEVLLGGLDLLVAEAVHHGLEVGATGEQP